MQIALVPAHVAEPLPADREVALPRGVAGVGGGKLVGDVLVLGEGLEGALQVALGPAHVAELSQLIDRSRCHSALPGSAAASLSVINIASV